jgi:AmmeMemoRadiSam system protein B
MALRQSLDRLMPRDGVALEPAIAVVVPHGSYRHAGAVAGAVFGRMAIPRRCILIGPSHTGSWMPWSLMTGGAYRTPLGDVPVDEATAEALRRRCPFLEPDAWGQRGEHAIEVLLPFLQHGGPSDLMVVPIVIGTHEEAQGSQLADGLAQVVRLLEEPVLLIASSDLSHYSRADRVAIQDGRLIDAICAVDGTRLLRESAAHGVAMCGDGPVRVVLDAARQLGAQQGTCVAYATSAEAGGDPNSAIGYAGVVIR